jgi:hypothetical protein
MPASRTKARLTFETHRNRIIHADEVAQREKRRSGNRYVRVTAGSGLK